MSCLDSLSNAPPTFECRALNNKACVGISLSFLSYSIDIGFLGPRAIHASHLCWLEHNTAKASQTEPTYDGIFVLGPFHELRLEL